jgi:hypothetical protein
MASSCCSLSLFLGGEVVLSTRELEMLMCWWRSGLLIYMPPPLHLLIVFSFLLGMTLPLWKPVATKYRLLLNDWMQSALYGTRTHKYGGIYYAFHRYCDPNFTPSWCETHVVPQIYLR